MRSILCGSLVAFTFVAAACVGDAPGTPPPGGSDGGSDGSVDPGPNDGGGSDGTAADTGTDAGDPPPTPTGTLVFNALTQAFGMLSSAVAFDGQGGVYVGGMYVADAIVDMGNGKTLPENYAGGGTYSGYVAKFDATGTCQWALPIAGTNEGNRQVAGIAAMPNGDLVFTMNSASLTTTLGALSVAGFGSDDIVVGRVSGAGVPVWLKIFGRAGNETTEVIAVDRTTKRIALGGRYSRPDATDLSFDGQVANPPIKPASTGFVAVLDENGVGVAAKAFPIAPSDTSGSSTVVTHAVTFDNAGNVLVGGEFAGSIELRNDEGGTSQIVASKGGYDGWLAKLNPTTKKIQWATTIGGTEGDILQGISVDPASNVWAAFSYRSTFNIGPTQIASAGGADIGIVRFDENGGMPFVLHYGSTLSEGPAKMVVDRWGYPTVVGLMMGTVDFGKPATGLGNTDGFIAKLLPTGGAVWAYGIGSASNSDQINNVAVDASGKVAVVGTVQGTGDPITLFGRTVNVPPGKNAVFVSVLNP